MEHAVDSVADVKAFLLRLDVDIAGPLVDGVGDDVINQFDNGGLLHLFPESLQINFAFFVEFALELEVGLRHIL